MIKGLRSWKTGSLSWRTLLPQRQRTSATAKLQARWIYQDNGCREQQFRVPTGNTKTVNLSLTKAAIPACDTPVIILLRRGLDLTTQDQPESALSDASNSHVISIEYELSSHHRYPLPVHQVLYAWDWIRQNLLRINHNPPEPIDDSPGEILSGRAPKVGVCGELVGGSLAAMLAVTECRQNRTSPICAAALGNPISDWSAIFPEGQTAYDFELLKSKGLDSRASKPRKIKGTILPDEIQNKTSLIEQRRFFFRHPTDFLDPFASPLLFFMSPSIEIPTPEILKGRKATISRPLPQEGDESMPTQDVAKEQVTKVRRYYRPFPPSGLNLLLPSFNISVGKDSPLKQQGIDLFRQLRRVERANELNAVNDDGLTEDEELKSQNVSRMNCEIRTGHGLWTEQEIRQVGNWFGEVLRK